MQQDAAGAVGLSCLQLRHYIFARSIHEQALRSETVGLAV